MKASLRRKNFFILDFFLVIITILGVTFVGQDIGYPYLISYLAFAICSYLFFLFLFSAIFLNLHYQRFNLNENFRTLAYGVSSGFITVFIYSSLFLGLYQRFFIYRAVAISVILFIVLSIFRYIEWKYIWPTKRFTVILIGNFSLLYMYMKDILPCLRPTDKIIVAGARGVNKSDWPFLDKRIEFVSIDEACDIINKNKNLTSIVLSSHILDKEYASFLSLCYKKSLSVIDIEGFYELICYKIPLFETGNGWAIYSKFICSSLARTFVKRTCDILFSLILLIVTLPIWLILGIIIKLDSRGPILFKQERVGYNGRPFVMLKFRTMYPHKDDSDRWPHFETKLVTRSGRLLRRIGLDELPQLINILKGEMSFVGPRAARPLVVERHVEKVPLYSVVSALRPGVTGWAQLHQGQDINDETVFEKVKYNLYYAKNKSLFLDLEIIFKTIKLFLLRNKPARGEDKIAV